MKKKNELNISQLTFIKSYLSYLRLRLMIERNVLMIDSMKEKLPSLIGDPNKQNNKGKMTKPEDLIRFVLTLNLFSNILLNPLTTNVPIISKPVSLFALQIN